MAYEAAIRDYLAKNLHVLEPNFKLIKKEFELNNPLGANGSIDILARDRLGHYVIIEIKRSDQAARAALHELTKYIALCKSTLGISSVPTLNMRLTAIARQIWEEAARCRLTT